MGRRNTVAPTGASMPSPAPQTALEKVRLLKPHNHAGVDYDIDAEIHVSASTAEWLRARGVIAALIGSFVQLKDAAANAAQAASELAAQQDEPPKSDDADGVE